MSVSEAVMLNGPRPCPLQPSDLPGHEKIPHHANKTLTQRNVEAISSSGHRPLNSGLSRRRRRRRHDTTSRHFLPPAQREFPAIGACVRPSECPLLPAHSLPARQSSSTSMRSRLRISARRPNNNKSRWVVVREDGKHD